MTVTEFDGPDGLRWGRVEVTLREFHALRMSLFDVARANGIKMVSYDSRIEPNHLAAYGPLVKQPEPVRALASARRKFDTRFFAPLDK